LRTTNHGATTKEENVWSFEILLYKGIECPTNIAGRRSTYTRKEKKVRSHLQPPVEIHIHYMCTITYSFWWKL
jgi:hypothetical protein